jgi:hypothetical protein
MENIIKLGLINGRHPLPVENYIIEESELNSFTKEELKPIIENGLKKLNIQKYRTLLSNCYYQYTDKDYNNIKEEDIPRIELYITGLTIVTLVTLEILNYWQYDVDIIGFNPVTKEYYSQGIFNKNSNKNREK